MESIGGDILKLMLGTVFCWFVFYFFFRVLHQSRLAAAWLAGAFSVAVIFGAAISSLIGKIFFPSSVDMFIGGRDFMRLAPIGFLIALNFIATPALYFIDKTTSGWTGAGNSRIPELVLHFVSFIGGAVGAFISQRLFRHKTRKMSFQLIFLVSVATSLVIYYFAVKSALSVG